MYKNILIPTDGSALSRKAAVNAVNLAAAVGAKVTAFYAAPPSTPIEYKGILPAHYLGTQKHARLIEKAAAEHLGYIENAAQAAGVACKSVHVTSDFPADAIVSAAQRNKCDLIFMASHGRRGLRGLLLGSQAQKVLAQSKIPVLIDR
jgi:nucleotide-binding universal stress UspA family protein